jgi:Mycothiol maleylpyruvate isomerase N-terminal domain
MYADALSFLEDEREAFRPFERLLQLSPDQLEVAVVGPDRWSGRDLMAHLAHGLEHALAVARELAVGERSPAYERGEAEWAAGGEAFNARVIAEWRALPLDEVIQRFRVVPGELRGHLTVVPEARWLKSAEFQRFFAGETIDHYADHEADLAAILEAVA